jgi:hypothetical protein
MPQFDTYRVLERYAKHPGNRDAILGFLMLYMETENRVRWNSFAAFPQANLQQAMELFLGVHDRQAKHGSVTDQLMASKTKEEEINAFIKFCAKMGVTVDPELLKRDKK